MKVCPYCKHSIEDDYPYCPNCNKPLISNLGKVVNRNLRSGFGEPEFYPAETEEEDDYYGTIYSKKESQLAFTGIYINKHFKHKRSAKEISEKLVKKFKGKQSN